MCARRAVSVSWIDRKICRQLLPDEIDLRPQISLRRVCEEICVWAQLF